MGIFTLPFKLLTSKLGLIVLLLLGIIVGVYLVQNTTIFRSRATNGFMDAFEIRVEDGKDIRCYSDTCYTDSDKVDIKLRPNGTSILEQLP